MLQFADLTVAFRAIPGPMRGAAWMLVAAVCFTLMNGTIRVLSTELPAFEIVFLRNLCGLIFMMPWLLRSGAAVMQTNRHRLYLWRSVVAFAAMLCWFSAVSMMPLAEATAVTFTGPIFSTIASVVVLGEVVRARRVSAMAIGLVGVAIVLRPGLHSIGLGEALVLANAVIGGVGTVLVKQLTRTESSSAIVTYMTLYTTPLALIPALFVWVTPSWTGLFWVLALGFFGLVAHHALTRAFAAADTSLVILFDYARLPFTALLAWLAFDEVPDVWTWVGGGVIIFSTVYIAHREAAVARAPRIG